MADEPRPSLATPTDLATNEVSNLADALNGCLADTYAVYLKTKNFHWHVSGPHFRDYHLMFDEQATELIETTDVIAERIRKTGNVTLRSIGEIGRRQTITDNDSAFVAPQDMLKELRNDNLSLIEGLRAARELAEEAKDTATSSLADEWIDAAEKRAWFLFEAGRTGAPT